MTPCSSGYARARLRRSGRSSDRSMRAYACYVRVQPGWYRFDPSQPLPQVRVVTPPSRRRDALQPYSRQRTRYRVKQRTWRHNVYRSRLEDYRNEEDASLEVRCGFGTPQEVVFVIPISFLIELVIPYAHCNELGRYNRGRTQRAAGTSAFNLLFQNCVIADGLLYLGPCNRAEANLHAPQANPSWRLRTTGAPVLRPPT